MYKELKISNAKSIFSQFLNQHCPEKHTYQDKYPDTLFEKNKIYIEVSPSYEKSMSCYMNLTNEEVFSSIKSQLEAMYGDLLCSLKLHHHYADFVCFLHKMSQNICESPICSRLEKTVEGHTIESFLYEINLLRPISHFLTKDMKLIAQTLI